MPISRGRLTSTLLHACGGTRSTHTSGIYNTESRRRQSNLWKLRRSWPRSLLDGPGQSSPFEISQFPFFHHLKMQAQPLLHNILECAEGERWVVAHYCDQAPSGNGVFCGPENTRGWSRGTNSRGTSNSPPGRAHGSLRATQMWLERGTSQATLGLHAAGSPKSQIPPAPRTRGCSVPHPEFSASKEKYFRG